MSSNNPQVALQIAQWIDEAISNTKVYDLHTHLYPPTFGPINLWGIDELVTYHYLIAETLRISDIPYEAYWSMSQQSRADLIYRTLFIENAPISESCRGVLTVLKRLGLEIGRKTLDHYREFCRSFTAEAYVDKAFELANVHTVVMTNDVFDPAEREVWLKNPQIDKRYQAVLRIDPLLGGWPKVADALSAMGYPASGDLSGGTLASVRKFLGDWLDRMKAIYVACSLPPDFRYPDATPATKVIDEAILPICRERNIPFAVMIGVRKLVNPALKLAGDAVGLSDVAGVDRLCVNNPHNKFMCTMLARENQHGLAVSARKHRNLFLFGCWWFLNNPVLVEEITRMRMELLGTSFAPQHSDARVLDQIIYKWDHSRAIIAKVMKDKFTDLAATGWPVTQEQVRKTTAGYLSNNFAAFLTRKM